MKVTISIIKPVKNSIYCCLKGKLGREPSNAELREEVNRILKGEGEPK